MEKEGQRGEREARAVGSPKSETKVFRGGRRTQREWQCQMLPGNQEVEDSEETIVFRSQEAISSISKNSFCGVVGDIFTTVS